MKRATVYLRERSGVLAVAAKEEQCTGLALALLAPAGDRGRYPDNVR